MIDPEGDRFPQQTGKGFTFIKMTHYSEFGIDKMGCGDDNSRNGGRCNPYEGDTLCSERLPLLCIKEDNTPRPPYDIIEIRGAMPSAYYQGWNRGHIATTVAVQCSQFATIADANQFCADSFG